MHAEQLIWKPSSGWDFSAEPINAQWVIIFGDRLALENPNHLEPLKIRYPQAILMGCSTAGEIAENHVLNRSIVATAVHFEHTQLKEAEVAIHDSKESFQAGKFLIEKLQHPDLRHVFLLSEGLNINGSELVAGMRSGSPAGVNITGGLAADGPDFKKTVLVGSDGIARTEKIRAVGFYGHRIEIGFGSYGGWEPFGLSRYVTKSDRNILYELDNTPALEVYKTYLGRKSFELPSSALLFPLSVSSDIGKPGVVRTVLGVDEKKQSLIFAGDVPQGSFVRLMQSTNQLLIEGAKKAAETAQLNGQQSPSSLAILISCVGRKLVMEDDIESEIIGVRSILGQNTTISGFYSYGEICPFSKKLQSCELHNQTMTITTFSEG